MKQNLKSYFHRQNTHTYTQLQISTIKCKIIKMVVVMKTNHIRSLINVLVFLNLHTQHIAAMPPNIPVDPQYNKQETFPLILMPPFFLSLTHTHTPPCLYVGEMPRQSRPSNHTKPEKGGPHYGNPARPIHNDTHTPKIL